MFSETVERLLDLLPFLQAAINALDGLSFFLVKDAFLHISISLLVDEISHLRKVIIWKILLQHHEQRSGKANPITVITINWEAFYMITQLPFSIFHIGRHFNSWHLCSSLQYKNNVYMYYLICSSSQPCEMFRWVIPSPFDQTGNRLTTRALQTLIFIPNTWGYWATAESYSVGLGWGCRLCILNSCQVIPMLLVQKPHLGVKCLVQGHTGSKSYDQNQVFWLPDLH